MASSTLFCTERTHDGAFYYPHRIRRRGPVVDLIQVLNDAYNTPWLYMLIAFGYAVLVALVLPIPIEIALLLPLIDGRWGYLASIGLAIAAGEKLGAGADFLVGAHPEGSRRNRFERWAGAPGVRPAAPPLR